MMGLPITSAGRDYRSSRHAFLGRSEELTFIFYNVEASKNHAFCCVI